MPDLASRCLRLTHDAHARIEQWIGQPDAPQAVLAALLDTFEPGFTMIATDGGRLPGHSLPALFAALRGSRPGLKIGIDELAVLHVDIASVLLTYRESHVWAAGATQRRATALFAVQPDGSVRWTHLHETWA